MFDIEGEKFEMNFSRKVGVVTNRFVFDKNLRSKVGEEGIKIINNNIDPNKIKDEFIIDARGCIKCINPAIAIRCVCKKRNQKMFFMFNRKIMKSGYLWIFPMSESLVNVGVGGIIKSFNIPPVDALNWFLKEMNMKTLRISAAPICLDGKIHNLIENNIIKVGERAGLVNPVTGEGIYYAMKSGKIAANCIKVDEVHKYEELIKSRFSKEFKISNLTSSLLKLPAPIERFVFKFGVNHLKSKIEGGSLNII